jgi:hypothetical protein
MNQLGIDRDRGGGGVELGDVGLRKLQVDRAEIVRELVRLGGADQHAGDRAARQQPGDRDLRNAGAEALRDDADLFDQPEAMLLVERQDVEARITVVRIGQAFAWTSQPKASMPASGSARRSSAT